MRRALLLVLVLAPIIAFWTVVAWGGEMRLSKFLTRAEAGELKRRLKRAGYRSTEE